MTPFKKDLAKKALYLILLFTIASSLYCSDIFIYRSLTPFFSYLVGISAFLIYAGLLIAVATTNRQLYLSRAMFLTILLGLYIFIHGLILSPIVFSYTYYLIANCSLLISMSVIIIIIRPNFQLIFKLIIIAAFFQSGICFLQYLGVIKSLNSFFEVTGTWENPNVTAMFIAMAVPCTFALFNDKRRYFQKATLFILLLFISTLFILKCRTAIIGAITGVIIIANSKYQLLQKAKIKQNRTSTILIASILLAFIIPVINHAYLAKKASADGRKLVWKISSGMVVHKPLFGYGYGSFE